VHTTDEQLVKLLQAGEASAFALLYGKYRSPLYGYCYRLLQDEQLAEDAVHDTLLKIWSAIATLERAALFRAWMFQIARNEVLQHLRRLHRNGQIDTEKVWEEETPFEQYERLETKELVQSALRMLRPEYREVLILREYEQFSYAEIAAITGTTESSVKSRIFKARKELLKKLEPYFAKSR
jgi:RNA polymerase sigma-70 factor (ECF subfamily)